MNWIAFVAIAVISDVFRVYLDNYITDYYFKERYGISQRLFYGAAYIIFAIILAFFFASELLSAPLTTLGLFFLSGIFSSLAGIPYYRALEMDDSTNLGIFFQFAPILYLILNWLFFGQSISPLQFLSILVILAAPATIVLTSHKRSRSTRLKSMFLVLFSVFIEVVGSLIFVNNSIPDIHLTTEIIPVFLGHGICNILLIVLVSKWRKRFFHIVKKSKKKVLRPMFFDAIFSAAKTFAYKAALVLAPTVALASTATDAISPAAIFFSGIILTIIWPNFGREKLTRKSVLVHLVSTILVAIGIVLMQL